MPEPKLPPLQILLRALCAAGLLILLLVKTGSVYAQTTRSEVLLAQPAASISHVQGQQETADHIFRRSRLKPSKTIVELPSALLR